ncbi:MAG TPA: DUF2789 domain-containing protein [Gammaproteobacteria bacterium]|nr:DUF2789 domain-containing protein [Gammaproteobacteria bacterium]
MQPPIHDLPELFEQLGLPNDEASIDAFIQQHRPIPLSKRIWEADFWNPAQAEFLQQAILEDADWVEVVDQLNALLR